MSSSSVKDWPVVGPDIDQEHAAALAHQHGVAAIPVVSADGRPLGLIPALALIETLAQEHREDVIGWPILSSGPRTVMRSTTGP